MDCKDVSELLVSYLDGELTEEGKEAVELHLSTCHSCRKELEALSATQNRLIHGFEMIASKDPSPQAWTGLQQRLISEEETEVAVFSIAKSKLRGGVGAVKKGLVSRQPVWKSALAGALVVALIAGIALIIPSHIGQPQEVLAAEVAQNDPQVHELLLEGTAIRVTKIVKPRQEGIFHVLFLIPDESIWGEEYGGGAITIDALVDVRERKVVGLRAVRSEEAPIVPLTVAEKEKAAEIARADPRVQEILNSGAEICRVVSLPFLRPPDSSSAGKLVGVVLMAPSLGPQVKGVLRLRNQRWIAVINLDGGKVVRLIETSSQREPGAYASSEGSVRYFPIEGR